MSDYSSAKFLSKQMKARGLQKLRFYCQVCMKQCRDDNGFKSHIKSPSHLKKISQVTTEDIDKYTAQFESDFLTLLRVNHGEKLIAANKVYNEFIQDRDHIHMNSTQFTSLNKFIQHLSKEGKIRIQNLDDFDKPENIEMGSLLISYVDTSGSNTVRKQQLEDIEKLEKADQEVKSYILRKQIEAGLKAAKTQNQADTSDTEGLTALKVGDDITIDLKPSTKKNKVHKKIKRKPAKNMFD
ncbi:similar to Saccharomyces cerevisiae YOR077W RTS2 Basic zinc-finger protein [Maudiozyma saulgeensis]|uniref:Similar to Saccharomyces cerevisiae YOR077W RTS2 Basic zinc-finger protein n=1 Tax=Maudiozyma saulgeensis TaxID=1789683 RepID=A0A1X7QWV1_9SACH|nr:similar to Saccharomyces cerevisiae YOR077W RTS2 Basic zinc-finger protein [Kazachstania saulgeensis]